MYRGRCGLGALAGLQHAYTQCGFYLTLTVAADGRRVVLLGALPALLQVLLVVVLCGLSRGFVGRSVRCSVLVDQVPHPNSRVPLTYLGTPEHSGRLDLRDYGVFVLARGRQPMYVNMSNPCRKRDTTRPQHDRQINQPNTYAALDASAAARCASLVV